MARMRNWTDRWENQDEKKNQSSSNEKTEKTMKKHTFYIIAYKIRSFDEGCYNKKKKFTIGWISKYVLDIICIRIRIRDFFLCCSVFSKISLKWKRYKMNRSLHNNIDQMKSNNKPNKPNDESRKTTHEIYV